MQLSSLETTEPAMKHIISLELTGMEQDHGYNAIAIVMNADDPKGTNDMFHDPDHMTLHPFTSFPRTPCRSTASLSAPGPTRASPSSSTRRTARS